MIGYKAYFEGELYPYSQVTTYGDGSVACTGISMDGMSWLSPDIDKIELVLVERVFTEKEISDLQSAVHKITGDGEVMQLFNALLGVSAG